METNRTYRRTMRCPKGGKAELVVAVGVYTEYSWPSSYSWKKIEAKCILAADAHTAPSREKFGCPDPRHCVYKNGGWVALSDD
jgi:hypothetical protein